MSEAHEIDYDVLIDRSIKDFQPAKRLWSVPIRVALWILLEGIIVMLAAAFSSSALMLGLTHDPGRALGVAALVFASIGAAFLALRSAIPGREATTAEVLLLATAIAGAIMVSVESRASADAFAVSFHAGLSANLQIVGFAALPWLVLFWAVRRGVPLDPGKSGGLVGAAAFCFALAAARLVSGSNESMSLITWQVLPALVGAAASALTGIFWLNPSRLWRQDRALAKVEHSRFVRLDLGSVAFPLAAAASLALLIIALKGGRENIATIPDFDLAIASYEKSLANFSPNVPSSSIDTVLTAYVEKGMPSYMWDFGPAGFRLVGGRFDRLSDGTPVTYTWFRGRNGGVMCMLRPTNEFKPPSLAHEENRHLFFYNYRSFSVCLIDVGGYGNFVSVIVAPMPMTEFMRMVLSATL
jgi:negative regulator of sigma F NrsF-like protein